MTAQPTTAPAALAATPAAPAAALEGDVHQPLAAHYTYGTDLDYVLAQLDTFDPIDAETEDAPEADWAVHKALEHVRAEIIRRKAVQAGPRVVDFCGLDSDTYGRACGPALGLPQCAWHGRPDPIGGARRAAEDDDREPPYHFGELEPRRSVSGADR